MPANVIPLQPLHSSVPMPRAPFPQARIDRLERWRTNDRWGDLGASTLTNVLQRAQRGDVADWVDLCEFAIGTDSTLASLYDTRLSRVVQADWVIRPSEFGNPTQAELGAEFVNDQLGRIEGWHQTMRDLMHATAVGFAAGENRWEYDELTRTYYVRAVEFRHGHRLRYDEQWQLRLYDRGTRRGDGSLYGEALDPRLWTIHTYRLLAGYPGIGGLMRSCIYPWLFGRWVGKMWIGYVEKHGDPLVYAEVSPNTSKTVRDQILSDLQNLSSDHVGVIETPNRLVVEAAAAATKSYEAYRDYMSYRDAELTKCWLGATDIVEPGQHGSQSAVDTRASVALDPRMVADGEGLTESLRRTLFKQLIHLNPHKFSVPVDQVPIPTMRLKTADDEVRTDRSDLAEEQEAERDGYTPEVGRDEPPAPEQRRDVISLLPEPGSSQPQPSATQPAAPAAAAAPTDNVQKQALNGAQVTSLVDLIVKVSNGEVPRASAVELVVVAFPVSREQAEAILGAAGAGFVPKEDAAPAGAPPPQTPQPAQFSIPKAGAPASSPGRTTRTRQTSSRSPSPFAQTLRNASGGLASSSSKASRKPR